MDSYQLIWSLACIFLSVFINTVSPGANDLHLQDGSSTADIIAGDIFFEILDPPQLRYTYRIRPAKDFGSQFNDSTSFRHARLVPTEPLDSCSDIVNVDDIVGQVALAERGECSFVFKTAKAQQAGARAVIITESIDKWDDELDHLIEMMDDKMDIEVNIPAGFLLGRSGGAILRTLKEQKKRYAVINLPVNMTYTPLIKMNQPPWIAW